jgi:hypothetical protein
METTEPLVFIANLFTLKTFQFAMDKKKLVIDTADQQYLRTPQFAMESTVKPVSPAKRTLRSSPRNSQSAMETTEPLVFIANLFTLKTFQFAMDKKKLVIDTADPQYLRTPQFAMESTVKPVSPAFRDSPRNSQSAMVPTELLVFTANLFTL